MADLIDRQALLRDIEKYHLSDGKFQHWVEVQPSVDAVEVVRCKDCKHRHNSNRFGFVCDLDTGDPYELGRDSHKENWYCADGERKDG